MSTRFHARSTSFLPRALMVALLSGVLLTLTACGGSGGGSTTTTSYVTGIAASGAPLAAATVTLTDAKGTTATTTTDANGAYTINVSSLTLPFVVRVSGISANALVDLTSMQGGTGPVSGQILQVDLTPLTNAIAAMVSHNGDPTALNTIDVHTADVSGLLTNVRAYVANSLLTNTLGYAGDPISSQFAANGSGYDGVLDNLAVITDPGSAAIYDKYTVPGSSTITPTDDTGEMTSAPTPIAVVVTPLSLTQNTNYTVTAAKLDTTAIALPGNNLNSSLGSLQTALNSCFATTSPNSSTCTNFMNMVATTYLNNGTAPAQFFTNFVASDTYVFDLPSVVRYVTPTEAIVQVSWTRSDHIRGSFETVAKYGSAWQLVGNQRNFAVTIQPVAEKRQDLNTNSASVAVNTLNAFTVGLDIRVQNSSQIMWAQVAGQGLGDGTTTGNGVVLMPQSNCSSNLTFVSNNASGPGGLSANGSGSCDSYYRLAGVGLNGTITWPSSNSYRPSQLNDTGLASISLFEPYAFRIHYCAGTVSWSGNLPSCSGTEKDAYYVERLVSLMPTMSQAIALSYPTPDTLTPATSPSAELTPGSNAFAGGPAMTVNWDPSANYAPLVDNLYVQIADSSCNITAVNTQVPFSASYSNGIRMATATASVAAPTGSPFPAASSITSCTSPAVNMVKFSGHRKDGLQIRSVIEYANY